MKTLISKNNSNIVLLVFLIYGFLAHAANLNYNVERQKYGGSESNRLQQVINNAKNGDIIFFNSSSYNFNGGRILIGKPLELRGLQNPGYNANSRGANAVGTKFNNLAQITIRSNKVTLRRLDIQAPNGTSLMVDVRHPNYIRRTGNLGAVYLNFKMFNCFLRGAFGTSTAFNIFGGNGFSGEFNQVTFERFTFAAINFDRKGPVKSFPKIVVDKCRFVAKSPVSFNDWAISFDAGNEEYPFIWNANGTEIKNSVFVNTGVAFSRTQNAFVRNNIFNHNEDVNIHQIHIEEFSRNITATGNTFNCNTPTGLTNIFGLDIESQTVENLRLNNNFINGRFRLFVSGYSPSNIEIRNNVFGPTAQNTKKNSSISLTFSGIRFLGQAIDDLQSTGITIRGNQGLSSPRMRGGNGKVIDILLKNGTEGLNTDIPNSLIERKNAGNGPRQLIPNGVYFIENTKGRLQDPGTNGKIVNKGFSGNFVRWRVERITPYNYSIRNIGTGHYLEAREIFKVSDFCRNNINADYKPIITSPYSGGTPFSWTTPRPLWFIPKISGNEWLIQPGGNEIKSVLSSEGGINGEVVFASRFKDCSGVPQNLNQLDPQRRFAWKFIPVSGGAPISKFDDKLTSKSENSRIGVFPNIIINQFMNIELGDNTDVANVNIYSISGKLVYSTSTLNNRLSLNTSSFINASGVYIVKINTSSNNLTQKIVVQ